MKLATTSTIALALALMLPLGTAQATLSQCTPSANCGSPDKPCNTYISQGATKTLSTSIRPGDSVIRVRVCLSADAICKDGANTQAVSVFGYSGTDVIYTKHLNINDGLDTGAYTRLPAISKLRVRCNSAAPGAYCLVAWQHCKEELPLQSPGA
jgi:hypothetical protein